MKPIRFADSGAVLSDFNTHFEVHCPECHGKALVNPNKRLTCLSCFKTEAEGRWYGGATAYIRLKCLECHTQVRKTEDWKGQYHPSDSACKTCGQICLREEIILYHTSHKGLKTDLVFGLPLWLQKEFRDGEIFWAYNTDHLDYLEQFISAKLRERGISIRNINVRNSSMISRLPTFMIKAGNRDALLKLIEQLRHKS